MKHTQGPWTVKPARNPDAESDPLGLYVIEEAERKLLALEDASMDAEPGSSEEQDALDERNAMDHANASLIAAAPDLYAGCELLVQAFDMCGKFSDPYFNLARKIATEAIAKAAEGSEPPPYFVIEKRHRLFAAAPDLLAALQELLSDKYLADPINAGRMANARLAVSKATGKIETI